MKLAVIALDIFAIFLWVYGERLTTWLEGDDSDVKGVG
jgi:hypothetical protein